MGYSLGTNRYSARFPWESEVMRLDDEIKKCVVFLGELGVGPADEAPFVPKGTGFLIVGSQKYGACIYLVTAKHIAEKLHPPFAIRFNKKGGGADLVHFDRPEDIDWCFHPTDETVDIAVAPCMTPDWADSRGLRASDVIEVHPKELASIGPGCIAYVVGLFHLHRGKKSNQPIVHVGNVAMLASDERVPVDGELVRAHLVQVNAISGCSGSPVFATRTVAVEYGENCIMGTAKSTSLLGVWSAAWKVKGSEITTVRTDDNVEGDLAPLGMGVVTPAEYLVEILLSDKLKIATAEFLQRFRQDR